MLEGGTWIFGYGSLMWNPGFDFHCSQPGLLCGYHRSYGMYTTRNRGTPGQPGMVLSLLAGGQCVGMGYHITPGKEAEALEYLDKREGVGRAHRRVRMPIHLSHNGGVPSNGDSRIVHAHTYLPITSYANYIQGVPLERQAELIAQARGTGGTAYEYLHNLLEILARLEVREPVLEKLYEEVNKRL